MRPVLRKKQKRKKCWRQETGNESRTSSVCAERGRHSGPQRRLEKFLFRLIWLRYCAILSTDIVRQIGGYGGIQVKRCISKILLALSIVFGIGTIYEGLYCIQGPADKGIPAMVALLALCGLFLALYRIIDLLEKR